MDQKNFKYKHILCSQKEKDPNNNNKNTNERLCFSTKAKV